MLIVLAAAGGYVDDAVDGARRGQRLRVARGARRGRAHRPARGAGRRCLDRRRGLLRQRRARGIRSRDRRGARGRAPGVRHDHRRRRRRPRRRGRACSTRARRCGSPTRPRRRPTIVEDALTADGAGRRRGIRIRTAGGGRMPGRREACVIGARHRGRRRRWPPAIVGGVALVRSPQRAGAGHRPLPDAGAHAGADAARAERASTPRRVRRAIRSPADRAGHRVIADNVAGSSSAGSKRRISDARRDRVRRQARQADARSTATTCSTSSPTRTCGTTRTSGSRSARRRLGVRTARREHQAGQRPAAAALPGVARRPDRAAQGAAGLGREFDRRTRPARSARYSVRDQSPVPSLRRSRAEPADEKLWATLIQLGGLFFGFLAPLIGYLVLKDRGPFVACGHRAELPAHAAHRVHRGGS